MHVQIVLFDGFDPLDVIAPYEVLHTAGIVSGGQVTAELVSAEGPREVASSIGGLTLRATALLDPCGADVVLVPGSAGSAETLAGAAGGAGPVTAVPDLFGRALRSDLPLLLKSAMELPAVTVAAVCGGSLLLAMAGLLRGRRATTHHLVMGRLVDADVEAVAARVVDDGDLVTGAGVTSGLDLALYLLEREVGPQIAQTVETLLAHERRGTPWRVQGPVPTAFASTAAVF
ncbi:glutamine amidotransferase [Streptomyces mashuensis]|uniref:Glutamine amidotransferase n=1 Tax=Streptomyces mashuensis TaxID=33904 RepID=A0A919EES7_9ACTN|nr:DJ-1/PfpI family protein [Streptomyces mashuensis]GHF67078.1 glutamine amidotransferase [Streptomyces mashuensis]